MKKTLPLFIAWRYLKAQQKTHFISFISLISMVGIGLGVAVLITVLSVMNGYDEEIHTRFFDMAQHMSVSNYDSKIINWTALQKKLDKYPSIEATAPFIAGQALLGAYEQNRPVMITGILPSEEEKVSHLANKISVGQLADLKAGQFGLVLGQELADSVGLNLGDAVTVMIPRATISPFGLQPRFKRFKVVGIFSAGPGFGFDKHLVFIHLNDAQKLYMMSDAVSGIRLKIKDIYMAPRLSLKLQADLGVPYVVNNWTQQFGAFFDAVKMEKTMMFFILMLIIAVAAFNLVSSLVMLVNEKRADIAILRTFGALPKMILHIFIAQGLIIGFIGICFGIVGGIALANNASQLVDFLQKCFHMQLISSNVYFVDHLPSKILISDILKITTFAALLSFLATIYPAWRASRIEPAKALRYE